MHPQIAFLTYQYEMFISIKLWWMNYGQVVMGSDNIFLTWVGLVNFFCSGQVKSAIFGLGLDLENFP